MDETGLLLAPFRPACTPSARPKSWGGPIHFRVIPRPDLNPHLPAAVGVGVPGPRPVSEVDGARSVVTGPSTAPSKSGRRRSPRVQSTRRVLHARRSRPASYRATRPSPTKTGCGFGVYHIQTCLDVRVVWALSYRTECPVESSAEPGDCNAFSYLFVPHRHASERSLPRRPTGLGVATPSIGRAH